MRELNKVVSVNGKNYQIGRFSAMVGSYVCMKIMGKISGIAVAIMDGKVTNPAVIASAVSEEIGQMSKQEFIEIQSECLRVCFELLDVGGSATPMPLVTAGGEFASPELATDAVTCMLLTVHALVFNLSPFFDENTLKGVIESFPALKP